MSFLCKKKRRQGVHLSGAQPRLRPAHVGRLAALCLHKFPERLPLAVQNVPGAVAGPDLQSADAVQQFAQAGGEKEAEADAHLMERSAAVGARRRPLLPEAVAPHDRNRQAARRQAGPH